MNTCGRTRAVDRHFAGALGPRRERALRQHLPACEVCRARYERHLLLAPLDPRALPAERRIAIGLGLRPGRAWRRPALAAAAAAAALCALLLIGRSGPSEFTARGPHSRPAQLLVYRVPPGGSPVRAGRSMAAADELAFAFENPHGWRRLLVFGVDEHLHIYWYHPAWTEASSDPSAVPIASTGELPEAISHRYDGRRLVLHAVFTDEAITVRQVEAMIRGAADLSALGEEDRVLLEVEEP